MPPYQSPGVYIEEIDTGIRTIEGVSTSVAGMVGATVRGPFEGLPQLVTSFAEFERLYGGYFPPGTGFLGHRALPHAVNGFFTNGGQQLYIVRVAPGVTRARKVRSGALVTKLGLVADVSAGDTTFIPQSLLGIAVGTKVRLDFDDGTTQDTSNIADVTAIDPQSGAFTVNPGFTGAGDPTLNFDKANTTVAFPNATAPASITFEALEPGPAGRDIEIKVAPRADTTADVTQATDAAGGTITVSAAGFYPGAWIEIDRGVHTLLRKVTSVDSTGVVLTIGPYTTGDFAPEGTGNTTKATIREFDITVAPGKADEEEYLGLTLENVSGKYIVDRLASSALIKIGVAGMARDPYHFPAAGTFKLDDIGFGTDGGEPQAPDYVGTDDGLGNRTGIKALEGIDQISIIAAPGITHPQVQRALILQCEALKDRFAILDPTPNATVASIQDQRNLDLPPTRYAAIYFPSLRIFDPMSGEVIDCPPSGHMAGIYARVDTERGVHKAPANEIVRGAVDFTLHINKATHDILNPQNINVFRDFRADGRGLRIWGARVMVDNADTQWKYINVRRLFLFLEESIDQGIQWVVFEPNDEPLWARVRQSISAFLTRVWRDGALQGATAEEAFFVKCDRTTMTQDDIDNGRLIVLVGVAPVKPAEFVIIRISQWTAGAAEA